MKNTLLLLLTLTFFANPLIYAQDKWDITDSKTTETQSLDVNLTEGTWISVDVSPDGQSIVFDLLGHIYQMPVEGGKATVLTDGRSWNVFPRYSPDGSQIAFTSDRSGSWDIWTFAPQEDSLRNISKMNQPTVQPTWSADGQSIYGTTIEQSAKNASFRFSLVGGKHKILEGGVFQSMNHFEEHTEKGLVFFEHNDQNLFQSGARIKTYDLQSGEIKVYLQRPGGAFNPALSPDGKYLAYGHRSEKGTEMILHNIETREEKVLVTGLDRDHQDYKPYYHGVQANFSWHPGGQEIFYSKDGKIYAVNISDGKERNIPFSASVSRKLDKTILFPVPVPQGTQKTLSHRWAHRAGENIIFESLGDIYLKSGDQLRQITSSEAHETSPIYRADNGSIYYARWSDEELGAIYRHSLNDNNTSKLTNIPSQYGGLTISKDGAQLAFFRGKGDIRMGTNSLEGQTDFELIILKDGKEHKVTDVSGSANFAARLPLTATFSDDGAHLYYTEFVEDKLHLQRIRTDGFEKKTVYDFPHAVYAKVSDDLKWLTYREYHRSFITPFDFMGKTVSVSAFDKQGFSVRLDTLDGPYMTFPDAEHIGWVRADKYYEKSIADIIDKKDTAPEATDLSFQYQAASPNSTIALTNAKVLTMNGNKEVLERATVLIENNRIAAIGRRVRIPDGAKIYDLRGHTIMPGMVDAHAHYGTLLSQFNTIEQKLPGLESALAYGVTTMYELYGTAEKDSWVMDMLRAGKIDGPRLFTVASPVFGMRFFRPKLYRPIQSIADAREVVRYNKEVGATALKDYAQFKRSERHMLAVAAREMGMNVVCETAGNSLMNWTQIVDGMSGLEHSMGITPLYQDIIEMFKASDIGITPTLLVVYNGPSGQSYFNQSERVWENEKLLNFATKEQLLTYRRTSFFWPEDHYAPEMAAAMKTLFDNGVLINMGGHGQMFGLDAHWEMELLVQGGFSPLEAIQCATINGAKYHGIDEDLGSLEVGKLADLVVLEKDPTNEIKNTRSIKYVMKNGVIYNGMNASRVYPEPKQKGKMYFKR